MEHHHRHFPWHRACDSKRKHREHREHDRREHHGEHHGRKLKRDSK